MSSDILLPWKVIEIESRGEYLGFKYFSQTQHYAVLLHGETTGPAKAELLTWTGKTISPFLHFLDRLVCSHPSIPSSSSSPSLPAPNAIAPMLGYGTEHSFLVAFNACHRDR